MDNALAEWLALREPADTAARSTALTRAIVEVIAAADPVQVLDLATGTGSNLRYLAEHLPSRQQWLMVDRDSTLLAQVPMRTASWGVTRGYQVQAEENGCAIRGEHLECHVETRQMDLRSLDDAGMFSGRHLVTASALLDLVSERWLHVLAARCREVRAAVLFAITYNGRSLCSPAEPEDEMVLDLFNRHQRTDKGLGGTAAGPDGAERAVRCFEKVGYQVRSEPSDWKLGSGDRELQRQLIEGWAEAATAISPEAASTIASWQIRRLHHVEADRSRMVVGHFDVGAWLPQE